MRTAVLREQPSIENMKRRVQEPVQEPVQSMASCSGPLLKSTVRKESSPDKSIGGETGLCLRKLHCHFTLLPQEG